VVVAPVNKGEVEGEGGSVDPESGSTDPPPGSIDPTDLGGKLKSTMDAGLVAIFVDYSLE